MNQRNLFKIIALPVCLLAFGLTSCEKDDVLPEVVDSEVYDNGAAGEVTVQETDGQTQMSYESWIMVRGVTRSSFDNKVTAVLNGKLSNVYEIRDVREWNDWTFTTHVSREASEYPRTEGYVTITDSLLVYTVSCEDFEFSYQLRYEVGVYDDGVSKQTMPYHYYSNIRDNGGVLEDMDSYDEGGYVYARKLYKHSITVDFGGKSYDVEAEVVLRRDLGLFTGPYPLRCEVVDKSIEPLSTRDGFLSSITIKSAMSDGTEAQETYSRELYVYNTDPTHPYKEVFGSYDNLQYEGMSYKNGKTEYSLGYNDYFHLYEIRDTCVFHYNYVDVDIVFAYQTAVFDNGVICEKMENYTYDSDKVVITSENWDFRSETDEYASYYLVLKANNFINGLPVVGIYSSGIRFLK